MKTKNTHLFYEYDSAGTVFSITNREFSTYSTILSKEDANVSMTQMFCGGSKCRFPRTITNE